MRPGGGFTAGPHSEACRPCRRRRTARPSRPPPAPCRQLIFRFFPLRNMCGQESPPHGHAGAPLPPHASSCARGPASPSRATPPKTTQSQGRYDGIPVPVAAAPFPIPASSHPAGGPLPLYPAIVTADDSLGSSQSRDSRRASTRSGIRGEGPARRPPRPPPLCPSPATCLRTCRGRARVARRGPSPADRRFQCSRTSCASNPMRAASPLPFPPSSSLPAGSGCPPFRCTPTAVRHARRALKRLARPVRRHATGGPVYCRPRRQRLPPGRAPSPRRRPSPARTRHPLCAPPARRTPSPLSSRHAPDSAGARVGPAAPPPARRGAAPLSPRDACMRAAAHDPIGNPDRRGAVPQAPRGPRMRP